MTSQDAGPAGAASPAPAPRKRRRRLAGGYRGGTLPAPAQPPDFGEAFFQRVEPNISGDDLSEADATKPRDSDVEAPRRT